MALHDRGRRCAACALAVASMGFAAASVAPASAQDSSAAQAQAEPQTAPVPEKPQSLTSIEAAWTNFLGSPVSGDGDPRIQAGGRMDAYVTLDGRDIGLWDGLIISAHPEVVYGQSVNRRGTGTLLPVNTALAFPSYDNEDFDLSLNFTQAFPGGATVTLGKINMIERAGGTPIVGGGGLVGFQHISFAAPPTIMTPPTIFGMIARVPISGPILAIGIWDPNSAVNRTGFEDMFSEGVTGMLALTVPLPISGRLGFHTLTLLGSTEEGIDLDDIPDIILPPEAGAIIGRRKGPWHIRYAFQQFVWQDPGNPARGWGLFGQVGVWDANPSPTNWGMTFGVTGSPPIASRPLDRFGAAYFRTSFSRALKRGLAPILDLEDEQGVELFYTFQFGKHFAITANAQAIDPVIQTSSPALFLGLRTGIRF